MDDMDKIQTIKEQDPEKIKGFLWIRTEIFDNPNLSGSDIMVYATLMRYMNSQTKECFPSIKTLREKSRIRNKCVMASLDKLEKAGLILRTRTRGKVNHYVILEPGSAKNDTSANGYHELEEYN